MITQYYRPHTLEEALQLLSREDTRPLGGGTLLSRPNKESFSVVDLQTLGLDQLHKSGGILQIGATVTLQTLLESSFTPKAVITALALETPLNVRTMRTVAGTLVTCDGRSPFATVMLALDAKMTFAPGNEIISLGDYLPIRVIAGGESQVLAIPSLPPADPGRLITKIAIPLNVRLAFETVARTPTDKPIVCTALAQWPSGRTRLTLGGWGKAPALAMDGSRPDDLVAAARNAFSEAGDEWATKEYRIEIAAVLAKRCLAVTA
ncbi:MAG: FAD binding domain-containing protein [Anaerolineales bacterium]|jgi:CO/xanthine dehydrogenase FAD-binding subunit